MNFSNSIFVLESCKNNQQQLFLAGDDHGSLYHMKFLNGSIKILHKFKIGLAFVSKIEYISPNKTIICSDKLISYFDPTSRKKRMLNFCQNESSTNFSGIQNYFSDFCFFNLKDGNQTYLVSLNEASFVSFYNISHIINHIEKTNFEIVDKNLICCKKIGPLCNAFGYKKGIKIVSTNAKGDNLIFVVVKSGLIIVNVRSVTENDQFNYLLLNIYHKRASLSSTQGTVKDFQNFNDINIFKLGVNIMDQEDPSQISEYLV